jgi:hypothetical protein
MAKVTIGCKLPNGLIIEVNDVRVTLNGVNKSNIIGATHCTTEVEESFWATWLADHKDMMLITSGAIFVAKNADHAAAFVKDNPTLTGFEGAKPEASGVEFSPA